MLGASSDIFSCMNAQGPIVFLGKLWLCSAPKLFQASACSSRTLEDNSSTTHTQTEQSLKLNGVLCLKQLLDDFQSCLPFVSGPRSQKV